MDKRLLEYIERFGGDPEYFKDKDLSEEEITKIIGIFEACDSWTEFTELCEKREQKRKELTDFDKILLHIFKKGKYKK